MISASTGFQTGTQDPFEFFSGANSGERIAIVKQTTSLSVAASGTPPLGYQWYAGLSGTTTSPISGATSTTYTTPALTSTKRYWVRVSNSAGIANSNTATISVPFTDSVLTSGTSVIRVEHITELRARIDEQRIRFGLSAFPWNDPTLSAGTTVIRAVHITELRTALAQAFTAAGLTPPTYTDPVLTAGITPVKAVHITELRTAVLSIE